MRATTLICWTSLLVAACDESRARPYTDPIDLFEPIATSHGLVLVERNRNVVMAFALPDFEGSTTHIPGVAAKVMPRTGERDSILVLNGSGIDSESALSIIHAPLAHAASKRRRLCLPDSGTMTPPMEMDREPALNAGTSDPELPENCGGPRAQANDSLATSCDASSDGDSCSQPGDADLSFERYEVKGAFQDWWQSPEGRYVLLTGRAGSLSEAADQREVALVPLACPRMLVKSHASPSDGDVLQDVVFSAPLNDGYRLVALRQSGSIRVLEYQRAKLTREYKITRQHSVSSSGDFAPREMIFVHDRLVVREAESKALLVWHWQPNQDNKEVVSVWLDNPATSLLGVRCGDKNRVIVAVPAPERGVTRLVNVDLANKSREELHLDLEVRRVVGGEAATRSGSCLPNTLIATDLADYDAKLAIISIADPFATQSVPVIDLPQGLHDISRWRDESEDAMLLTYAQEGGGRLNLSDSIVRSFGRGVRLEGAVADSEGRLWVTSPDDRSLRFVDPSSGGLPVTVPLENEATRVLAVGAPDEQAGFIVAWYASTAGGAAVIPSCSEPGDPHERRLFIAKTLSEDAP